MTENYLTDLPKADEDESLGSYITLEEIKEALNSMENNKSPGPDGLTKEFYREFIDLLGPILVKLYRQIFNENTLTSNMKLSYITLICKNENIPYLCKNYRPISLLNIDYKIITKVLSSRLRKHLPSLIHPDQSCSVKGRCIQDNCHYLRDIIDNINEDNSQGLVLSLDQEKAFDRVDHVYLLDVLTHYGLNDNFIKWIKILYTDISSAIIVNNHISNPFKITRSVRQGCPLSPLLYVLALEPVLIHIRKDRQVLGCTIPSNRINPPKVTAFADDCKFVLKTHESVEAIFKHFSDYSKISGAKLNKTKTEIMYLGKWANKKENHLNIKIVTEMDIFGITYGNVKKNWEDIVKKTKRDLNFYLKRKLSYIGKAKLCNILILPKIWYLATIFPPPSYILREITSSIYNFVWNRGKDKINRETMTLPIAQGGIGLVDIKCKYLALFLNQMMKVFNNISTPWVNYGHQYLGLLLRKYDNYKFDNCSHPHRIIIQNGFYKEISKALKKLEQNIPNFKITPDLDSKKFYKLLLQADNIRPRCIPRNPQIDFKEIFLHLDNKNIDYLAFNVTFLATHGVLPVAQKLNKWKIDKNPNCKSCPNCPETEEHLFIYCAQNHLCKHWLLNIIYRTYNYALTNEDLIFGFQTKHINSKQITFFLTEYRLAVWLCRNRARYECKTQKPRDSLYLLKSRINLRLQADYIRLKQMIFERQWLVTNLATLRGNRPDFNY